MRLAPKCYLGSTKKNVEVGGISLTLSNYCSYENQPWHSHENPTFAFVFRGAYVEQTRKTSQVCAGASLLWHPHTDEHAGRVASDTCSVLNIELMPSWLRSHVDERDLPARNLIFTAGPPVEAALQLLREFHDPDPHSKMIMDGLMLQILGQMGRDCQEVGLTKTPNWVRRTCELVRERLSESFTIGDIAKEVEQDPVFFARKFRRYQGVAFHDYVRRERVNYAKSEIAKGDKTLGEIAFDAGFADQAHFSRDFKRVVGLTPSAYRQSICVKSIA